MVLVDFHPDHLKVHVALQLCAMQHLKVFIRMHFFAK